MRGYPDYNFPAFYTGARILRDAGWSVFSPAERDDDDPLVNPTDEELAEGKASNPLAYFMQYDLAAVCNSDAVVLLPGWEASQGARLEVYVALEVGKRVFLLLSGDEVFSVAEPEEPSFLFEIPEAAAERGWAVTQPGESAVSTPGHACLGSCVPSSSSEVLPTGSEARKGIPLATGLIDYFPAALAAVAAVSKVGNDKHNPGEPLHWARGKSMDQADCIARHLIERGSIDSDTGLRHSAQLAWRALALLQLELEDAGEAPQARAAR